jgi:hypothetical protein
VVVITAIVTVFLNHREVSHVNKSGAWQGRSVALAVVAGSDQRGISSSVKIMFERYTEKARRVVFFARYEASGYGSPFIETEHLLLGLTHEDQPLLRMFLGDRDIRSEIEQHITRRERFSTSVEIPLTMECRKALNLASDEAQRLAQRRVDTQHVLLGIMGVRGSLAAQKQFETR